MGQALSILSTTKLYYGGLFHYLFGSGRYGPYLLRKESTYESSFPSFINGLRIRPSDSQQTKLFKQHARIHLFSLASAFYLYDKPHYRKGSYRDDLIDNLRNVAIPGSGIPLSIVARSKVLAFAFLVLTVPSVSFLASVHRWFMSRFDVSLSEEYATRLLAPDDWFSYWRLNCNVVGLHALLNDIPKGYDMENKWTFLEQGAKLGVPISPFLNIPGIVVKHRNEEGGMGIHFYRNATNGGDWIIQETIANSDWVSTLLPPHAPLSTFRVITQSRASLNVSNISTSTVHDITALSCVFRAGRQGAATDHDSILYDVDVRTGLIRGGTTNAHWYRLGLQEALPGGCPWRSHHSYTTHPDGDIAVSGNYVPEIGQLLALVEQSHYRMCPDVPFAGWDVVLSSDPKLPVCLLEVNLSCNFFRGSFDKQIYLNFIDDSFSKLQAQRLCADAENKKFKSA